MEPIASLLSTNKTFVIVVGNYAEARIKVFCSCPILFNFSTLFEIFGQGLSAETHFCLKIVLASIKRQCFNLF